MNRRSFLARASSPTPGATAASALPAPIPLSINAGLEPHTAPLDRPHAAHLLRRTGFGVSPDRLNASLGQPATAVAAQLVEEAVAAPLPEPPAWINEAPPPGNASNEEKKAYDRQNRTWRKEWTTAWFADMHRLGLRERMTLFLHNHFVTEYRTYKSAPFAYRYVTLLREHALGNFKDLVRAIGVDAAMLFYLNGKQNRAGAPNENYARELLELFTMGPFDAQGNENYTQTDIEEIARALTGWVVRKTELSVLFRPNRYDDGQKTFFGRTGPWGYNDVIDIIFEERADQIAVFIARKLYAAFIYAAPDESLVAELAQVFLDNNFEMAPVVSALLGSAHFFDDQVVGARVKSPTELLVGLLRDLDAAPTPKIMNSLWRYSEHLEQAVLNPPNVAGWPGHHAWLTTTTFVQRRGYLDQLLRKLDSNHALDLVALAEKLHDPDDALAAFTLPVALAQHLLSVPLDLLDLPTSNLDFAGDLASNPIPDEIASGPAYVRDLTRLFLAGVPWYEWHLHLTNAPRHVRTYILALTLIPEFQLT